MHYAREWEIVLPDMGLAYLLNLLLAVGIYVAMLQFAEQQSSYLPEEQVTTRASRSVPERRNYRSSQVSKAGAPECQHTSGVREYEWGGGQLAHSLY